MFFKGDYLALNLGTYAVKDGESIVKTDEINQDSICLEFWYSLPSTTSNLKIQIESLNGGKSIIWQKSGFQNKGAWTKESIIVNYNNKFKVGWKLLILFFKKLIYI